MVVNEELNIDSQTSTLDIARQVARQAIANTEPPAPDVEEQPPVEVVEETAPVEPVEPVETEEPEVQKVEQPVEPKPPVEETVTEEDQIFYDLLDLGIQLPMRPSEVPPEMRDVYDAAVETVISQTMSASEARLKAQEAILQTQEFAKAITEDPITVLKAMMLQSPEAFTEAVSEFERISTDEGYADLVRRELAANAKLSAAERREQLQLTAEQDRQVEALTRRTHMVADRLGVPREVAEKVVAAAITTSGGTIELSDVDAAVRSIAPKTPPVRAKTPEQAKREQEAPGPVTGKGDAVGSGDQPAERGQATPRLTNTNPLRAGIQKAIANVTARQRGEV